VTEARIPIQLPEFEQPGDDAIATTAVATKLERRLAASVLPRIAAPVLVGLLVVSAWEGLTRVYDIPYYVLPGPLTVVRTVIEDWGLLSASLLVTLRITFEALVLAAVLGGSLAVLFSQSRLIEMSFFPYAVILQVTPIIATAPLILIWADDVQVALIVCAWIVAFFPILSNTTLGLRSADHNLVDLFHLYGASRGQALRYLRLPAAMPYFLAGLKISGGLSLIGAVVAEFVAGTGGRASGLAYRILESGFQLKIPRMFAALLLISLTGVCIFVLMSLISHLLLRSWHESAIRRET
jgi:NitT/TauT family transport system permease protein